MLGKTSRSKRKKEGHLVIFVVDGSGAQKRIVETKGAVQSLLIALQLAAQLGADFYTMRT